MFDLITTPEAIMLLAFGLTEIAKRNGAPDWALNALPTIVGLAIGSLCLLNPEQVYTFNEVFAGGSWGFGVTLAYKGLSGMAIKFKTTDEDLAKAAIALAKEIKKIK